MHSDSGGKRRSDTYDEQKFVHATSVIVVQEDFGLELLGLLLLNGSDFQRELIMEELMQVIKGPSAVSCESP